MCSTKNLCAVTILNEITLLFETCHVSTCGIGHIPRKDNHVDTFGSFHAQRFFLVAHSITLLLSYPMAMALDPRLSPSAESPNTVDYIRLRTMMEEHFRSFPDGCTRLIENVNISEICTHIAEHRICPSLFTDYKCSALYHPEFIQRYDQILWLPRTWV